MRNDLSLLDLLRTRRGKSTAHNKRFCTSLGVLASLKIKMYLSYRSAAASFMLIGLRKAASVTCHFMGRFIFMLLFSLTLAVAHGQTYDFRTKDEAVNVTMNHAIINANKFIQFAIPSDIFKKHFQFNSYQSRLRNDTAFRLVTFDDSINFIPNKYEVMYAVVIDGDTLTDQFAIPVDSLGKVAVDTTHFHYTWDDINAYCKLLTGQYKFDYQKLKQFIKAKNLKNYGIVFMNSMSTLNGKNYKTLKVFKHYWYVTEYKKGGYSTTYTIDPDTGKVTVKNEKMKAVS